MAEDKKLSSSFNSLGGVPVTGAIVICDTLGFKGIWGRYKEDRGKVLAKLKEVSDLAHWVIKSVDSGAQASCSDLKLRAAARVFSDTVVFATWSDVSEPDAENNLEVLNLACKMTVALIDQGALPEVPFAYRGCVAFGEFYLAEDLIVGPAIDEAAEHMNAPDGAFVWLAPSAEAIATQGNPPNSSEREGLSGTHRRTLLTRLLLHCEVPLKDGRSMHALVVNPYAHVVEGNLLSNRILSSFNSVSLDVRIKKQNTAQFLDRARDDSHSG